MPATKKNPRKIVSKGNKLPPMKDLTVKPKSGPAPRTTSGGGGNSKRAM